ncbi:protein lplB [Cohnella sp. CIP 111063]|uniref:ABC transporter permease n=1 Tax=unclassified Cohnella TaxID=2636738 RepID=UPI000B9CDC7E|nr:MULTISPECIES: ABC transporter permease subunit [unclassified Cohnella]OXS53722.1 protein lplB [Cohnella sp. CIP 111063]PRX62008.1 putative aldouronate transport system permease protein [Cohnella sp. SGD-V74]
MESGTVNGAIAKLSTGTPKKPGFWKYVLRHRAFYLMLVPGILYFLVFKYFPLFGSVIAFQDFNIFKGFSGSDWVGFKWFEQLFTYDKFTRLLRNTLIISLYQIVFAFPLPIVLACLLNEVRSMAYKRIVQTVLYLPHFISWTIVFGLTYMLLSPSQGLVNQLIAATGGESIAFLQKPEYFRTIIISSGIWKEMGWNSIIFIAALAGINPALYEAARMDGANRWKQFLHISLPGILPAIMILLMLKIGHVMDSGFEQIWQFLNPATYETGDVFDTYTYRAGILQGQYSITTAIGLFKSVVGFVLLVIANRVSKMTTGEGLY